MNNRVAVVFLLAAALLISPAAAARDTCQSLNFPPCDIQNGSPYICPNGERSVWEEMDQPVQHTYTRCQAHARDCPGKEARCNMKVRTVVEFTAFRALDHNNDVCGYRECKKRVISRTILNETCKGEACDHHGNAQIIIGVGSR